MRILAIRGRNLASLAGDFEMCLDAPPLGDAGLFAITGRTGSGKSTTLDALCLALFDRMPRLPIGRGIEVGGARDAPESRLRNNDVRAILRRGTGEGYAEVDFRGVDGRRYRVRWSVRRARERAGGRCQAQTMALQDLDSGEDLSGTKTEVLEAIQVRLGLTFDQFRRSVLLAQGDFAAFLRADAGERAELLERITGTGIYGKISKAAHRRAAEERGKLDLVRQRLGDQRPLDEAARESLEAEWAEARKVLDEQQRAQQALQQAQRWYQTLDKLTAERAQAVEQFTRARAVQDAAEPRRREHVRICALQPLRLPLNASDSARDAMDRSRRDLEQSIAMECKRQSEVEQTATDAAAAEAIAADAQKARDDAIPALQGARQLDTRLQGGREQVRHAAAECASSRATLLEAKQEQERLQTESARAEEARSQAEVWLIEHAGTEPLAAQWDAWKRELERYAQACDARDKARAEVTDAERAGAALAAQQQTLKALIAQIGEDRARAVAERSRLEAEAAVFDLEPLAVLREERLARRDRVEVWRRLAEQARETRGHLAGTRDTLIREQARRTSSDKRLREIEAEISPLVAALAEAEEIHRRLLLATAGEVESLRAGLEEGEPCPVCGAEQHPWAHQAGSVLVGLADAQAERVAALKRRAEEMTTEKARKLTELEQAVRRTSELAADLDVRQALLDRTLVAWSACEADTLRPSTPFQEDLVDLQKEELQSLAASLQQIAGDEVKARDLQARVKAGIAAIEGLDRRLEGERKALAEIDEQIHAGSDARTRTELEYSKAEETMEQVLALVAEPLAAIDGWRRRLQAGAEAFVGECRHQVEAWRLQIQQRDQARQAHQDLAPRLARAQMRRQGAEADLNQRVAALERQSTDLAGLERERASLLEGRPVDSVEAELSAAVVAAQHEWEQSRTVLARMREALNAAQAVVVTRRQALQEVEAAAAQAQKELDRQVAGQGTSLDELREVMKRDQDWIEEERAALQALTAACDRSQDLMTDRGRRLDEHRAVGSPELTPEQVSERLLLVGDSVTAAQERWAGLHGQLGEDDRRRVASCEIQAELDRQQAAWELWESLRELIGSADGAKFRNFAQGLTLDLLVAHANEHLRDLARRYELQRVPGAEMEIQVIDREMGDEVRSIHSLSGGESFLVSLALALGLASLASDRVQVESLFIDEGFGALDADSLDLAIASLDALYSLGRQVGVISHVGTLVERIGVKVQVTKQGGGRSRLEVVTD